MVILVVISTLVRSFASSIRVDLRFRQLCVHVRYHYSHVQNQFGDVDLDLLELAFGHR